MSDCVSAWCIHSKFFLVVERCSESKFFLPAPLPLQKKVIMKDLMFMVICPGSHEIWQQLSWPIPWLRPRKSPERGRRPQNTDPETSLWGSGTVISMGQSGELGLLVGWGRVGGEGEGVPWSRTELRMCGNWPPKEGKGRVLETAIADRSHGAAVSCPSV